MVNAQRVFFKENSHFLQDRPHLKMVNAQRVFLKENGHFLQDRPHSPHSISLSSVKATNDRIYWGEWVVQKIWTGPGGGTWSGHLVGAHGGGTSYQHESLRLRRDVLPVTHPTSREHITLTHSHSRTYTPKDIIRTQKIYLLGKNSVKLYFVNFVVSCLLLVD